MGRNEVANGMFGIVWEERDIACTNNDGGFCASLWKVYNCKSNRIPNNMIVLH